MKFATHPGEAAPETPPQVTDYVREKNRLKRDRAARRRLADRLIPGLPVDADALETRVPMARVGAVLESLLRELTAVEDPYFDAVCAQWNVLFPDLPARPGRMRDQHLFLYVRTSGQLFALHSRLPKIRRLLATIPGAPRRLSVHLEIHAESRPDRASADGGFSGCEGNPHRGRGLPGFPAGRFDSVQIKWETT